MKVQRLIIHCSATTDGKILSDFEAIRNYHVNTNKWADIGYHWVIEYVNGEVIARPGRKETVNGAHCVGQNDKALGICVVGNFDVAAPDEATLNLLAGLCAVKCRQYGLTADLIDPHNKYAAKTCPGTKFPMEKLRDKVKMLMG